jgi:hypothetical protein
MFDLLQAAERVPYLKKYGLFYGVGMHWELQVKYQS